MAKKDYQNKASERVNTFVSDATTPEQNDKISIIETDDNGKKVNIMLRLDSVLGAKVKAKAKSMGLPKTKYIELLIRNDLKI